MNIYEINDLSNDKVIDILKYGISVGMLSNTKLHENYLYEYKHNPANLFYRLERGEYKSGTYFVITDNNDNYVASAGWYVYNRNTALVLTRMLVSPPYRTSYIIGETVLPIMIERTQQYENVWITCNDYNKAIYHWFERTSQDKSPTLYKNWPAIYKKFKPIGKRIVNTVDQYVVALEK
jgi:hypothetical protein